MDVDQLIRRQSESLPVTYNQHIRYTHIIHHTPHLYIYIYTLRYINNIDYTFKNISYDIPLLPEYQGILTIIGTVSNQMNKILNAKAGCNPRCRDALINIKGNKLAETIRDLFWALVVSHRNVKNRRYVFH